MPTAHTTRRKSSLKDHSKRHARLFEFMRQANLGEENAAIQHIRQEEELAAFREMACASLKF